MKWEAGHYFMLLTRLKNTIVRHRLSLVQVILVLLAVTEKPNIEVTLLMFHSETYNHNCITVLTYPYIFVYLSESLNQQSSTNLNSTLTDGSPFNTVFLISAVGNTLKTLDSINQSQNISYHMCVT